MAFLEIKRPGSKLGISLTDPGIADSAALAIATITEFEDFTCSVVSASSWTLVVRIRQEDVADGMTAFLLENDGSEGWFYTATGATDAVPKFLGRGEIAASAMGGEPGGPLYADVTFRLFDKPIAAWVPAVLMADADSE